MKAAPGFTLHELVTSNTTLGLGNAMTLHTTGERFLASDPYGSGTAPSALACPTRTATAASPWPTPPSTSSSPSPSTRAAGSCTKPSPAPTT